MPAQLGETTGDTVVAGSYDPKTGVVTINAAATEEDARNYIIKHELTHSIEGTSQYAQLLQIVKTNMGQQAYDSALTEAKNTYANGGVVLNDTQAQHEVVAEWVGKNLYKAGFVKAVMGKDRAAGNAIVRTLDRIRLALGGTKNSRVASNVEMIQRLFARALQENDATVNGDGVAYEIKHDINGDVFVEVDEDILTGVPERDIPKVLSDIIQNKFHNLIYANGQQIVVNQKTNREWRMSKNAQALRHSDPQAYEDKINAFNNADELLKASKDYIGEATKHSRNDNIVEFARGTVSFRVSANGYSADVIVGTTKDGRAILYDIINLMHKKITDAPNTSQSQNSTDRHDAPATDTRLAQNDPRVNTQSMQNPENNSANSIGSREWADMQPTEENLQLFRRWLNGEDVHPVNTPVETPVRSQVQNGEATIDSSSVKEQLRSSSSMLDEMSTVADIRVSDEFFRMNKTGKQNWVIDRLEASGYQVDRTGFGVISFAKKRLKSAFNYFKKGSAEEVVFEALPSVLENGVEISSRTEHKGRGYGTVTIAAPITINGKRGNMAVVVKRTDGNHYKVHRVLTPDGSEFTLADITNEAESTPAGESPINGSLATPINSASTHSIYKTAPIVKPNSVDYEALRNATTVDDVVNAVGDSEAFRRMYLASWINRPRETVDVDGRTMTVDEYMAEQYHRLPDDEGALRAAIGQTEAALADELKQVAVNGVNNSLSFDLSDHPNILKLNIQLFAEKAKLDYVLDQGEDGSKTRRFFEQRLKGKDANHNAELVEMLKGRSETYNPIGNQKTLDKANAYLRDSKKSEELRRRIFRYNPKDIFTDVEMAAAQVMINDAINNGELGEAADLTQGLSRKGTDLGRAVQIMSMQARLTPEGTLRAMLRTLQKAADKIIGEGASDSIDQLGNEIIDVIEERVRQIIPQSPAATAPLQGGLDAGDVAAAQRYSESGDDRSLSDLTETELQNLKPIADKLWSNLGVKSPLYRAQYGEWRMHDQSPVSVADRSGDARGVQRNQDTGWDIQVSRKVFNETRIHNARKSQDAVAYLSNINDIINKAILLDTHTMGDLKSPNSLFMHTMYAIADIGDGAQLLKLYVEEMYDPNSNGSNVRAYQLQNIEKWPLSVEGSEQEALSLITSTTNVHTVADLAALVKHKDKNYRPKPSTRDHLRDALVEDLAATPGNYLSKNEIAKLVDKVIDESSNIPEQVKRYVKKHLGTGTLAARIYEMQQKGHLNNVTLRRAMEEALGLPTLTPETML